MESMRSWVYLLLAVGLMPGLAGCTVLSPGDSDAGALMACQVEQDGSGEDPLPEDEVVAHRHVGLEEQTLRMAGCVVNGEDTTTEFRGCGDEVPVEVTVERTSDGEVVFARPELDVSHAAACSEWEVAPNSVWVDSVFDVRWDLHKDVCREDAECDHADEGERIAGGDYTVTIDGWGARAETFDVELPGP